MVRGTFALSYYSFLNFNFQQLPYLKLTLEFSSLAHFSSFMSLPPRAVTLCSSGMSGLNISKILRSSHLILAPEIIAGLTALGVEFTKSSCAMRLTSSQKNSRTASEIEILSATIASHRNSVHLISCSLHFLLNFSLSIFRRTLTFLAAMGHVRHIVTAQWCIDSVKAKRLLGTASS